jgi:hypothetical protein
MATTFTPISRSIVIQSLDPAWRNRWGGSDAVDAWPVLLEQVAAGITIIPIGGLTAKTLSVANNAPDQSRANLLQFNGALTGDCTVTIPGIARTGWAANFTSGGHNVILTTGAGLRLTMGAGTYRYRCDGVNVVSDGMGPVPVSATTVTGTTGTFSGNISSGSANPTATATNGALITPAGGVSIYTAGFQALTIGTGNGAAVGFQFGLTPVGSITTNSTTTFFNTASDARLKVTYGPADCGALIDAVSVWDAAFKATPDQRRPMVLAHELQAVCPWAVTGERYAVDITGDVLPQMVDHSMLVPMLLAEIKALRARVAALEGVQPAADTAHPNIRALAAEIAKTQDRTR